MKQSILNNNNNNNDKAAESEITWGVNGNK